MIRTAHAWPDLTVSDEERFLAWAHGGHNVFLTGAGGVGKSHLTRIFIEQAQERGRPIDVTASTGVAAILVGGSTIHSWAGIDLGPMEHETFEDCAKRLEARPYLAARKAEARIRKAECVLIDEISMLQGRTLEFLSYWMARVRDDNSLLEADSYFDPFGGCQMIFVGDFLQLSPVRTDPKKSYDWAFRTETWDRSIDKTILLETNRRQKDPDFTRALSAVRLGDLRNPDIRILRDRVLENPPRKTPRLLTHNAAVEKWNQLMLSDIPKKEQVFHAEQSGQPHHIEALARNILAPERLVLKEGALVMHLINKTYKDDDRPYDEQEGEYVVNGALGVVSSFSHDAIWVHLDDGRVIPVKRHSYHWSHHLPEDGGPEYVQYPLRLAWALTIHKAQGMTMDRAHIDIRAAREPGQAYVALSRVRTLAGLSLKEWPKGAVVSPQALEFYENLKPTRPALPQPPPAILTPAAALLSPPPPSPRLNGSGSLQPHLL
jgi:ATP-dependent exoDNAse (exonuclease V) alpha subunit